MVNKTTKNVLFISYYFPPMGMGGVQRSTKFARYLPEFGWQPYVITVKDIFYYAFDQSLLDEVNHLSITRTGSLDPARVAKIITSKHTKKATTKPTNINILPSVLAKFMRKIFYPDSKILWIPFAANGIRRLLRDIKFDAVYSTSPPISAHLVARKFKIPWIADFRDYWTTEHGIYVPTIWHKRKYKRIIASITQNAAKIVAVSDPIADSIRAEASPLDAEKVVVIPNGFDPNDFTGIHPIRFNRFTISYLGNLNPQRSPNMLISVIEKFIKENPEWNDKFQVYFIGKHFNLNLLRIAGNLSKIIHFVDYVPHADSLAYALGSNALLFILSKENAPGIMTGKIFEYLGTGKPILAIVPKHTTAYELLQNKPNCYLAEPDSPGQIKEALSSLLQDHSRLQPTKFSSEDFPHYLTQYIRKNQARELANLLDISSIKYE